MSLSRQEVRRIAALARLKLTAAEEELFAAQLSRVVDYIDQINRYSTSEAEPASASDTREAEDRARPTLARAAFIENAPEAADPFLVVPQVIGGGAGG